MNIPFSSKSLYEDIINISSNLNYNNVLLNHEVFVHPLFQLFKTPIDKI